MSNSQKPRLAAKLAPDTLCNKSLRSKGRGFETRIGYVQETLVLKTNMQLLVQTAYSVQYAIVQTGSPSKARSSKDECSTSNQTIIFVTKQSDCVTRPFVHLSSWEVVFNAICGWMGWDGMGWDGMVIIRLGICRDRRDRRSCKILSAV